MTYNKKGVDLFLISLLSLYFELVVIRWLSSEIRIFAYFKNIPLLACLFGLGLGMALAKGKHDIAKWFPAGLAVITFVICLAAPLHYVHVLFVVPMDNYLIGNFSPQSAAPFDIGVMMLVGLLVLVGVFYLLTFSFMAIGQKLGQLFCEFSPLVAYSINITGSLVGIALFSLVSFLSWSPPYWILLGVVLCTWFYRKPDQLACLVISLAASFILTDPQVIWSPYYRVSLLKTKIPADGSNPGFDYGYNVEVNYDTIEGCYNNNPNFLSKLTKAQSRCITDYYETPYVALGDKPRDVLILAAGAGNDSAAALSHGAKTIDAVDIDPVISRLGYNTHPERPYQDPRVHVIVDDARAFLKRTKKKYDLIVFSYLDSHSALSAMSSLRLDNYVYTMESFRDAARLLKPDGVMAVTFYPLRWYHLAHVVHALEQGTQEHPIGVYSRLGNGPTFLLGPGLNPEVVKQSGLKPFQLDVFFPEWKISQSDWDGIDPTTDDWPFLFRKNRGLTWTYIVGLLATLLLGWRLVVRCFGNFKSSAIGLTMFFLGAAFMLIETKSITQMALLLGTTWLINSIVIAAVLLMILLANITQMRLNFKNVTLPYSFLFGLLALSFLFPIGTLHGMSIVTRTLAGSAILSAPILFAAIIFAITFSKVENSYMCLGMNLLGTLVGGVLENLSMVFGVNAMNVIAAILYFLAWFYYRKATSTTATIT